MNDLGIEAVELIYEMFKVDEQWSVKEKRGFRWWGHKLCQKIYASKVSLIMVFLFLGYIVKPI